MPLFDKRSDIPRDQFKKILQKSDIKIGTGRQLSERERMKIEKVDFPRKMGSSISQPEYKRTVNNLMKEKINEQDFTTKLKLNRKIKFLKELERGDNNIKP